MRQEEDTTGRHRETGEPPTGLGRLVVMPPAASRLWPERRMKPPVAGLSSSSHQGPPPGQCLARLGCCPWSLRTSLESSSAGQRCLRRQSRHC